MFRSEDELDMEGVRITLSNGATSGDSEVLGVSYDSDLSTKVDLSSLGSISRIAIQKPQMFKAPVGFRLTSKNGQSKDVVSELYDDVPAHDFEDVPYAELAPGHEVIGVYGFYQAHYISHIGFLVRVPVKAPNPED